MIKLEFKPCMTCQASEKNLCIGCQHNKKVIEEAVDILRPLALMASAYDHIKNNLYPIAKKKHQALTVSTLRMARDALPK